MTWVAVNDLAILQENGDQILTEYSFSLTLDSSALWTAQSVGASPWTPVSTGSTTWTPQ